MKKRIITENEEKAYRLCHQDFEGLSTAEAAERMGVSDGWTRRLLASMKKKAPQLFPILTKRQAEIYHLRVTEGWTYQKIMAHTGLARSTISLTVKRAIDKGMPTPMKRGDTIQYTPDQDGNIRERF